jgi:hypothetical protein
MASKRLSVRIEPRLQSSIRRKAALARKSESVIVREALENYLAVPDRRSAYDVALQAGVIGCAKSGPRDLSSNPAHFEGFGEKR